MSKSVSTQETSSKSIISKPSAVCSSTVTHGALGLYNTEKDGSIFMKVQARSPFQPDDKRRKWGHVTSPVASNNTGSLNGGDSALPNASGKTKTTDDFLNEIKQDLKELSCISTTTNDTQTLTNKTTSEKFKNELTKTETTTVIDSCIDKKSESNAKQSDTTWMVSARVRHKSNLEKNIECQSREAVTLERLKADTDVDPLTSATKLLRTTESATQPSPAVSDTIKASENQCTDSESKKQHDADTEKSMQSSCSMSRWSSTRSVNPMPENEVWDNLRYLYPEAFLPPRADYLPELYGLESNELTEQQLKAQLLEQWRQEAEEEPLPGRLDDFVRDLAECNPQLKRSHSVGAKNQEVNTNMMQIMDQEMKNTFLENAFMDVIDQRRRNRSPGFSPLSARARPKSMIDICQFRNPEYVRDDYEYDYNSTMPYRSSTVCRYQKQDKIDSFLPPAGIIAYAPRIQCKRALPPDRTPLIADQIFDEYQKKLAQRIERKIKSTIRLNKPRREIDREPEDFGVVMQVHKEFMGRVKERNDKSNQQMSGCDSSGNLQESNTNNPIIYSIEGTASAINDTVAQDVKHLLEVDDSVELQPHLKDALYQKKVKNSVMSAAVKGSHSPAVKRFSSATNPSKPCSPFHLETTTNSAPSPLPFSHLPTNTKSYRSVKYDPNELKKTNRSAVDGNSSRLQLDNNSSLRPGQVPRPQSPTLTMLQQSSRIFPKGSKYKPLNSTTPIAAPNEKLYTIKREYEQELDGQIRKFLDLTRIPVEGVGPTILKGMPVSLKSAIKEQYQPEWYRRMFGSIHQSVPTKDHSTVDGRSRFGYAFDQDSSPDSDTDTQLYSAKRTPRFKNQPKRIEGYRPGRCSLSAREAQEERMRTPVTVLRNQLVRESTDGRSSAPPADRLRRRTPESSRSKRYDKGRSTSPCLGLRHSALERPKSQPSDSVNDWIHSVTSYGARDRNQDHSARKQKQEEVTKSNNNVFNSLSISSAKASLAPWRKKKSTNNAVAGNNKFAGNMTNARALHSFRSINSRELSLEPGDVLLVRRQVDENWLEGELNGRIGTFPINYVEMLPKETSSEDKRFERQETDSDLGQARALHNFEGHTPVELTLRKGDLIQLTRRVDPDWFEGRTKNQVGIFPASYVQVLEQPSSGKTKASKKSS